MSVRINTLHYVFSSLALRSVMQNIKMLFLYSGLVLESDLDLLVSPFSLIAFTCLSTSAQAPVENEPSLYSLLPLKMHLLFIPGTQ